MEDPEVPTEHLHETISEKTEEAKGSERRWSMYVAISTALIAVFAALSSLMAGHHSDEALIAQIKASDQWALYQAKGIKSEIKSLGIVLGKNDSTETARYKQEQADIKKIADNFDAESADHLEKHMILARAVTLFQIAIAISAIAILTRKKFLWYSGITLAMAGVVFFVMGVL